MQTTILSTQNPSALGQAQQVLASGGLIAFPTDTIYGLASSPFQPLAIEKLFAAKGRDFNKAIAVLLGSTDQIAAIAADLPSYAGQLAAHYWPGALTLVVPRRSELPAVLSPYPTIGLRMPDHPFALALLRQTGPLAVTSANLSGGANPRTAQDVLEQLQDRVDLILDGGECPGGVPSTVVDCTSSDLKILRAGAISSDDIFSFLQIKP